MATIDGIEYYELQDSPAWRGDEHGIACTRKFWLPDSSQWYAFLQNVFGSHRVTGESTVDYEVGKLPLPGFPNAFASSFSVEPKLLEDRPPDSIPEGMGTLGGALNQFKNGVEVTVNYDHLFCATPSEAHPGFSPGNIFSGPHPTGTHLVYEADFGGEYALAGGSDSESAGWKWSSDDKKVDGVQHGLLVPSVVHVVHWFWVLLPPWKKWRKIIGKVNNATFLGAPAGTLLLLQVQPVPMWRLQDGENGRNVLYRITYRFAETCRYLDDETTQVGHNYFLRTGITSGERWQQIEDAQGDAPYKSADFRELFSYGDGTV